MTQSICLQSSNFNASKCQKAKTEAHSPIAQKIASLATPMFFAALGALIFKGGQIACISGLVSLAIIGIVASTGIPIILTLHSIPVYLLIGGGAGCLLGGLIGLGGVMGIAAWDTANCL